MNEWCIYIALYCVLLYTQSALQKCVCVCVWGGGLSSTTTISKNKQIIKPRYIIALQILFIGIS